MVTGRDPANHELPTRRLTRLPDPPVLPGETTKSTRRQPQREQLSQLAPLRHREIGAVLTESAAGAELPFRPAAGKPPQSRAAVPAIPSRPSSATPATWLPRLDCATARSSGGRLPARFVQRCSLRELVRAFAELYRGPASFRPRPDPDDPDFVSVRQLDQRAWHPHPPCQPRQCQQLERFYRWAGHKCSR